jgi:hypothetical protein
MYKQCNIHLLPSNEKQIGEKLTSDLYLNKSGRLHLLPSCIGEEFNFQHLYITDDSEIREGDWVIETLNKVVFKVNCGGNDYGNSSFKKIIATTDKYLTLPIPEELSEYPFSYSPKSLPQIPKQFIEYYIGEYNAGRKIKQVDVEFEGELYGGAYAIPKLFANNEISIHHVAMGMLDIKVLIGGSKKT